MNIHWIDEDHSPLSHDQIFTSNLYRAINDRVRSFTCSNGVSGEVKIKKNMADQFVVQFRNEVDGCHYELSRQPLLVREDFEDSDSDAIRRIDEFLQLICSGNLLKVSQ
jgi:hypothetical protein